MMSSPEESRKRIERAAAIVAALKEAYPESGIALRYSTPFELLIATILSAQCTDERVNQVTPELFRRFPDPRAFAEAPIEELEQAIFSTGFYRNKAKSIQGAARAILEKHGGEVPGTLEELVELPGVGRKTANVILGHCFDRPGMVVDTHVKRISNLLGLAGSKNPDIIERELCEILPPEEWVMFSHLLADHGRAVCVARRPQCGVCVIVDLCPSASA